MGDFSLSIVSTIENHRGKTRERKAETAFHLGGKKREMDFA